MTINHLIPAMLLTMTAISAPRALGQDDTYRFDLGVRCGMSGYVGDLSSNFFKRPGVAAGIKADYLFNPRYSVGTTVSVSTLSGSIDDSKFMPSSAPRDFKSTAYGIDGRFNFNFLPYGTGAPYEHLSVWTPYVSVGVGAVVARCGGDTSVAPSIPLGVGVRYRLAYRVNLSVEFTAIKTFTDKIDGKMLDDPMTIDSAFAKNTDWMSALSFTISYEIGRRCATCHHID